MTRGIGASGQRHLSIAEVRTDRRHKLRVFVEGQRLQQTETDGCLLRVGQ